MLEVSRQSVSKWESGAGYPETDKLVLIADKLDVSLDYLLDYKQEIDTPSYSVSGTNKILITSFDGSQSVRCLSVRYSKIMFPSKNEQQYILEGVDKIGVLGPHTVILGWYEDEESIRKEMDAINKAIEEGKNNYKLLYYTDVIFKGLFQTANRKNID